MVSTWRNFKNIFSRPLSTMLKFHPYSILTEDTIVGFVIFCVLIKNISKIISHLSLSIRCFESIFVIGLSHTDNIDFWHCIFGGIFPRIVFIIVFAGCSDNYRVHRRNGFAKPCIRYHSRFFVRVGHETTDLPVY